MKQLIRTQIEISNLKTNFITEVQSEFIDLISESEDKFELSLGIRTRVFIDKNKPFNFSITSLMRRQIRALN